MDRGSLRPRRTRVARAVALVLAVTLVLAAAPVARAAAAARSAQVRASAPAVATFRIGDPTEGDPCGAETHLEAALARDPEMARRREESEAIVLAAQRAGIVPQLAKGVGATNGTIVYTIPTVVHIIHTGVNQPEYISDAQVFSQIEAVNRDLQNLNNYGGLATDCQIQLCLATRDTLGNPITGITRHQYQTATIPMDVPTIEAQYKSQGYYPSKKYLNVWVVKRITVGGGGGVVGYATFPNSVVDGIDGIVMDYRFFGANNTSYGNIFSFPPGYDEGKVFPHEVGHYLDLWHTFHGGCSIGDLCNDTPWEATNFSGCPSGSPTTSCNSNTYQAPIHNFMDYTNDPCRWEFTPDQKGRMFAAISAYRSQLVSATNLALTVVGPCQPNVVAAITPSTRLQCAGQNINFAAANCGGTCTFNWTFQGGTPPTATGQNAVASFTSPGLHEVTVTVIGSSSSATAVDTVFISACSPITGPCTNWVFGNKARLNFASGVPVAVAGNHRNLGPECAAQISNPAGNLLFYTDNDSIWIGGSNVGMSGTQPMRGNSSHTGALVIPRPSSITDYYLLSVKEWEKRATTSIPPFAITTVNASTNTIVSTTGVTLDSGNPPLGLVEGVTAVPQCNGNDWWAITCGADSVNALLDWQHYLYVTPITNGGAGTSVPYPLLGFLGGPDINLSPWGTLTASRDGNRIAVCQARSRSVRIFDFDRTSGVPTLKLDTGDIGCIQDVEFSPDGNLIYYSYSPQLVVTGSGGGYYGIRQLRISDQAVRTIRPASTSVTQPYDLQLGPDDRLYIARAGQGSLDVVAQPNTFNSSNGSNDCGYFANAVSLGPGVTVNTNGTLPNVISMCAAQVPPAAFTYTQTNCRTFTFTTANCPPYDWFFGDGTSQLGWTFPSIIHTYAPNLTGPFNVKLIAVNASPTTVIQQVSVQAQSVSIVGPGSACGGPLNYTAVGPANYTYQWIVTGGSPPTATGNNVFVSWGLGATQTIKLIGTDPKTGCSSEYTLTVDPCANCTPTPPNLVAWWPLDESGSETTAKELVAANDAADFGTTKVPCAVQYGRQFNATSSVLKANDHPKINVGTGNLTLDAWIRSTSNPTYMGIVEKRSLSPDLGYAMYLKNGDLAFSLGDGSTSTEYVATSNVNLIDGFWHHVAVTEDRGNAAAGSTLYIDGQPVTVLPGFAGSGSLTNTEKLLIGAQEPSASPTGFWSGAIDEVEVFNRALTAEEIAKIYGAGAGGKCREMVYCPVAKTLCFESTLADVTFYICNPSTSQQSYTLSFAGTPAGGACTIAGPVTNQFTLLSPNTNGVVSVQPGCHPFIVRVQKPNGMQPGDVCCFQISITNNQSGVSRVTNVRFLVNPQLCPVLTSKVLSAVSVGVVVPHTFQIQNTSLAPQVVDVRVEAIGVDQPPLIGGGVVSLNGQPPGFPWFTTYVLVPGESTTVHVDAAFTEASPFAPYDILLSADINGDAQPDAQVAAGMINSEAPVDVTAVLPPVAELPTRFDLVSTAPNPFHRLLAVQLDLPRAGRVKLELFDVSGRRVRSVVEAMAAGRALRMVDASGLPSGVYLLRFEAGGVVRTRNVVMLRE